MNLGPATRFVALPDPFPFWRGGNHRCFPLSLSDEVCAGRLIVESSRSGHTVTPRWDSPPPASHLRVMPVTRRAHSVPCRHPDEGGGSVHYEIRVKGALGAHWSAWFEGLDVRAEGEDTVISGLIPDQAALHGVLAKVRDLGLPLLAVARIDPG